jgi:filamentous hemagglutinin family protein
MRVTIDRAHCWRLVLGGLGFVLAADCCAQITLDGSLGPKQALAGPNFAIDSTMGQIRGSNLFHSFGRFNVQTGESASFTNSLAAPIANILSRVTGGERSFIDGPVRSTIAGANLYLLNPSGVVFGPNAVLDVSGAFHVSTADSLRLADGGRFYASLAQSSVLTVAPPVAFGFMSTAPAAISFDRSTLEAPAGGTLSVVAGVVTMTGATLRAAGGRINLASVASAGEVIPNAAGEAPDIDARSFARMGEIRLSAETNVTVSSTAGAGTTLVRGNGLIMESESAFNANTTGAIDGAAVGIDIRITGNIVMIDSSQIVAQSASSGRAGDVRIAAAGMEMKNGAFIQLGPSGTAQGGNLAMSVDSLKLSEGGVIIMSTSGPAQAGDVSLRAATIMLVGSDNPARSTGIFGQAQGTGSGGAITIAAQRLDMTGNSGISNASVGPGPGGALTVDVDGDIVITGSNDPNVFTGIFANAFRSGEGGTLQVTSKNMQLDRRASIQAASFAQGDAGSATVRTGHLELGGGSSIFSSALFGSGNAGVVDVHADTIVVRGVRDSKDPFGVTDFTGFSTTAGANAKNGGDVRLTAHSILLTDKGAITSLSASGGDAGNVRITADELVIDERSQIISSTTGSGRGGTIDIRAKNLTVSGAGAPVGPVDSFVSAIGAQAVGPAGAAGDISIVADRFQALDGARITTQTFGSGKGGNIDIDAGSVVVAGINPSLDAYLNATPGGDPMGGRTVISASTARLLRGDAATGNAGNVRIAANDVRILDGGVVSSSTVTPGRGGNVELVGDRVTLAQGALVTSDSSTSESAGDAGRISISGRESVRIAASSVTTAAERAEGGAIDIAGNYVELADGAIVSAKSSGAGDAGSITIAAADTLRAANSTVSTAATGADGGNVALLAPTMVQLTDSTITTSVGTGEGRGGNIAIDPQFVILDAAEIRADAFGGPGGNIRIATDVFLTQESLLSASSALSLPGAIDIQARVTDVSGRVVRLPERAPVAATISRASCAARVAGESVSSLILAGREGLPPDPEGPLPSPLIDADVATRMGQGWAPHTAQSALSSPLALDRRCSGIGLR